MSTINNFSTLEKRVYYYIRDEVSRLIDIDEDEDIRNIEAMERRASMKFRISVDEVSSIYNKLFNALYF